MKEFTAIDKVIKVRRFKVGYELRYEQLSEEFAGKGKTIIMTSAYNSNGDYIGDSKWAYRLYKRGIIPELSETNNHVCSIGFCEKEKKWYGWSHRAMYGFKIGDTVEEGDCCASSGFTDEYLAEYPDENRSLPIGFTAKTLEDCKAMAIAFAESVG